MQDRHTEPSEIPTGSKREKECSTGWLNRGAGHPASIKSFNAEGLQQADPAWELVCLEYQVGSIQKLLPSQPV